jgi:hypothetical protein
MEGLKVATEQLKDRIRNNDERLIKLTQGLVKIPSVSGDELKVQEFVYKVLKDMKLKPEKLHPDLDILRKDVNFRLRRQECFAICCLETPCDTIFSPSTEGNKHCPIGSHGR